MSTQINRLSVFLQKKAQTKVIFNFPFHIHTKSPGNEPNLQAMPGSVNGISSHFKGRQKGK